MAHVFLILFWIVIGSVFFVCFVVMALLLIATFKFGDDRS